MLGLEEESERRVVARTKAGAAERNDLRFTKS
jgi:hypothetical protein